MTANQLPKIYREYISGKLPEYRVEFRQRTKSGKWKWILVAWQGFWNGIEKGNPLRMLGTHTNITDRIQAENDRKQAFEHLELAITTAKLGVWTLDLGTGRLEWNDDQLNIYGITREMFEENMDSWRSMVLLKTRNMLIADWESFLGKTSFNVIFRIIRLDGDVQILDASASPVYDNHGDIVSLIGINLDITERKQVEDALKKSEAKFRELFYLLPAGVFTKDQDGRYTSTNDLKKMYTDIDPIGQTILIYSLSTCPAIARNDLLVMERGQTLSFEEQFLAPDGMCWMLAHKTPLRDEEGKIVGIYGRDTGHHRTKADRRETGRK